MATPRLARLIIDRDQILNLVCKYHSDASRPMFMPIRSQRYR